MGRKNRQTPPQAQPEPQMASVPPLQFEEQRFLSEDLETRTTTTDDGRLVKEISEWKREAKSEDNDRYFCHVSEVDQLAHGQRCYVIGRKGTGKTAICEYFNRLRHDDTFAEKLTFKNFPFNELYSQSNHRYTPPNQFISIWKYVIYSTLCRLMLNNQSVDPIVRENLSTLYPDTTSLSRRLNRWVQKDFGVSLFGISSKFAKQPAALPGGWADNVDFLEDVVVNYAGRAKYFVLFDELDEDYQEIVTQEQRKQYVSLLTSLFKAVQDVRAICSTSGKALRIYPVIFLRDDIFKLIHDSDKTKWADFVVDLNWDTNRIKKVIAFRISRALEPTCKRILDFEPAWQRLFGTVEVQKDAPTGARSVKTFDYIARATLLRPRDFVTYLQQCAQFAVEEKARLTSGTIKRADKFFSNYLRGELTDELSPLLPDIDGIFDVISQLRKPFFSGQDFATAYSVQADRNIVQKRDVSSLLQTLFAFSVIGTLRKAGGYVWKYENREANFNPNETIVVHRGLYKALQVY